MKTLALVLAVVFFIAGIMYMTGKLQFATDDTGPHVKHAIVSWVLALLSLIWYRFQTSPQRAR